MEKIIEMIFFSLFSRENSWLFGGNEMKKMDSFE